jgi:hypothetical protein
MEQHRWLRTAGLLVVSIVVPWNQATAGTQSEPPAFQEFTKLVHDYVKLVKSAPHERTTKKRDEIVERRSERAQAIRAVRPNAKPGEIFTAEITQEFRNVIRSAFQGPGAPGVRKTIREGAPLPDRHLTVNGDYPEHLPRTTVPPTLLLRLPPLPPEVAYQIVGHDFVLLDREARVVIDFITGALP